MSSISSTSTFASFDELQSPGGSAHTRLSCAPLVALAREMESTSTSPVDHLLETLANADRELEAERSRLRSALCDAEIRAVTAEREVETLTQEIESLKDLIAAREGATNAQHSLVKQLKEDNAALRDSYAAAVRRAGDCDSLFKLSKNPRHSAVAQKPPSATGTYTATGGTNDRRISVTVGGNRKDMRFSDAELAHVFQENERLEVAGLELIRQVEVQKDAHGKLKDTVSELMVQLEEQVADKQSREKRLKTLERNAKQAKELATVEEGKAADIQRKHNKLAAEYEMLEIAHKHSIAENNKLKLGKSSLHGHPHGTPGKKKNKNDGGSGWSSGGGVLGSVENLLHNRRNNNGR